MRTADEGGLRTAATVLIAVLLFAAGGVVLLRGTLNQRTVTPTTISVSTRVSIVAGATTTSTYTVVGISWRTTASAYPGLDLFSGVAPTTISSGQNVSLDFGLHNPLSASFTIVAAVWQPSGVDCPTSFPMTYNIYQGHYPYTTVSGAVPLTLYNATIPTLCFAATNSTFTFDSHSDVAFMQFQNDSFRRLVN